MATDRWNRLRACAGGLGMSMRIAASSCSSHSRATLGPGSPAAPDVGAAGRRDTSMTNRVEDRLNLLDTLETLLMPRSSPADAYLYGARRPNARENARQQCG